MLDKKIENSDFPFYTGLAIVGVLMLMAGLLFTDTQEAQYEAQVALQKAEVAPLLVPDRFTRSEAYDLVATRDADRANLWRLLCRKYPGEPECEGFEE